VVFGQLRAQSLRPSGPSRPRNFAKKYLKKDPDQLGLSKFRYGENAAGGEAPSSIPSKSLELARGFKKCLQNIEL
jgi:hypothetical protein